MQASVKSELWPAKKYSFSFKLNWIMFDVPPTGNFEHDIALLLL